MDLETSSTPILRSSCSNAQSDAEEFCKKHYIENECDQLINVVKQRCMSWSTRGDGSDGIVEIPVQVNAVPTCMFQITVDNNPHCVIETEDFKNFVYDDDARRIANHTCQLFRMLKSDCEVLSMEIRTRLRRLVLERIREAQLKSSISNHNGSRPTLITINHNYNMVNLGGDFEGKQYIDTAMPYLLMDKWRVKGKFNSWSFGIKTSSRQDPSGADNIFIQVNNKIVNNHEDRLYTNHTILLKLSNLAKSTMFNVQDNGLHACFHIDSPYKSNLYSSNGLDLGCHSLSQDSNAFVLRNIPFGAFDILIHISDFSKSTESSVYGSMRIVPIHVIPLLLPSYSLHSSILQNYKSCVAQRYNEMLPLRPSSSSIHKALEGYSFSICILAHRGKKALRQALASWEKVGLMDLAEEKILFLQEWKHNKIDDKRLYGDIVNKYGLTIFGEEQQIGIALGLYKLVERSRSEFILFLEEDFRIADDVIQGRSRTDLKKMIESEIAYAIELVQSKRANVVRMRRRDMPGTPNCAFAWKGSEHLLGTIQTPIINNQTVLDAHFWRNDLPEYFSNTVWRCGRLNVPYKYHCAFSTHASWTNNPIIFAKNWFLENIGPVALNDHSTRLEAAVSFSPPFWNDKCFIVGHGNGLFMHDDVDKPQWEQTVCPPPPDLPSWWTAKDVEKNYDL